MDLKGIRNKIVSELHNHLEIPVVPQDSVQLRPSYPYLTYKFTTPYRKYEHQGNTVRKVVESNDQRFKHDIEESVELQPQITLSINAYSKGAGDDNIVAFDKAKEAMNWFRHTGYDSLCSVNTVVVDTMAFGDRTALITDDYESRYGFDVILRTVDIITRRIDTIETWKIETNVNEQEV